MVQFLPPLPLVHDGGVQLSWKTAACTTPKHLEQYLEVHCCGKHPKTNRTLALSDKWMNDLMWAKWTETDAFQLHFIIRVDAETRTILFTLAILNKLIYLRKRLKSSAVTHPACYFLAWVMRFQCNAWAEIKRTCVPKLTTHLCVRLFMWKCWYSKVVVKMHVLGKYWAHSWINEIWIIL